MLISEHRWGSKLEKFYKKKPQEAECNRFAFYANSLIYSSDCQRRFWVRLTAALISSFNCNEKNIRYAKEKLLERKRNVLTMTQRYMWAHTQTHTVTNYLNVMPGF